MISFPDECKWLLIYCTKTPDQIQSKHQHLLSSSSFTVFQRCTSSELCYVNDCNWKLKAVTLPSAPLFLILFVGAGCLCTGWDCNWILIKVFLHQQCSCFPETMLQCCVNPLGHSSFSFECCTNHRVLASLRPLVLFV